MESLQAKGRFGSLREKGGPQAAFLIFVLQFRDVGFAGLELEAEAVPQAP